MGIGIWGQGDEKNAWSEQASDFVNYSLLIPMSFFAVASKMVQR